MQISVYDIQGKKITDILSKTLDKGKHTVEWDLTHQGGKRAGTGVYVARLSNSVQAAAVKIIVR